MDVKIFLLGVAFLFALSSCASALTVQNDTFGDVTINRLYPESAYIGQKVWITIAIDNAGTSDKTIAITDKLSNAEYDSGGVVSLNTTFGTVYYVEWKIDLPAGENTSVSYWIEPKSAGNYVISPSLVNISGVEYHMKSAAIAVRCDVDGTCESGEDYMNCPQDCASGAKDGICDGVADSRCDPDCATGIDPDCVARNTTAGEPAGNVTESVTANVSENANATQPAAPGQKENGKGFDLAAYIPYIVGIAIIAAVAVFLMRRKK